MTLIEENKMYDIVLIVSNSIKNNFKNNFLENELKNFISINFTNNFLKSYSDFSLSMNKIEIIRQSNTKFILNISFDISKINSLNLKQSFKIEKKIRLD